MKNISDQRIPQSNWLIRLPLHRHLKREALEGLPVYQNDLASNLGDIVNPRILQCEWLTAIPDHTHPKKESFPFLYVNLYEKNKLSSDSYRRYCWLKNPKVWLADSHAWSRPTKKGAWFLPFLLLCHKWKLSNH